MILPRASLVPAGRGMVGGESLCAKEPAVLGEG